MKISSEELTSKDQTGKEMHRMINAYSNDIKQVMVSNGEKTLPMSDLSINEAFDLIKNLPYKVDTAPIEVVSRPSILIENSSNGLDCKKKSILMCSYLKENGIPYRLIASSQRPDGSIHHVFPQMYYDGKWCNMDATYSDNKIFDKKLVTNSEVLT